jgi:hypothetical protein
VQYDYALDRSRRRVIVVMHPGFRLPDVFTLLDRLEADDGWGYGGLFDGRELSWTPTTSDIRQVVDHIARVSTRFGVKPGPAALVAGSVVVFGMGRMLATLGESAAGLTMNVFKDLAKAERWLDERQSPPA